MSAYLIEQIAGIENISVRTCCTVAGAQGDGHLEAVTLQDANTGERETLPASHLFVFIGGAPRTGWLDGSVVRGRARLHPDRPGAARPRAAGHRAGRPTATRTSWRPASPASSSPATSGPTR